MNEQVIQKLKILTESAKYDVSCASSGTSRKNTKGGVGNTVGGWGICHSFSEDGRCISLLKIMLTNYCIYDCAYCINRVSNDIPRATLSVTELVELTMEFYRRNYIEGLFLSSGVVRNPDYTMERLVRVAKDLRLVHRFNGYIHLKSIPGASEELVQEAGLYADRLSVNLEIPTEKNLKLLAPEKDHQSVYLPMKYIQQGILTHQEDRRHYRHVPRFAPGGQSTQMIVGATPETDKDILRVSSSLYEQPTMKRVYYSGYISVNTYDKRLPTLKQPPLVREKPTLPSRLAVAFLPVQGGRNRGRPDSQPGSGHRPETGLGPPPSGIFPCEHTNRRLRSYPARTGHWGKICSPDCGFPPLLTHRLL